MTPLSAILAFFLFLLVRDFEHNSQEFIWVLLVHFFESRGFGPSEPVIK